jgi:uncharacterized protein YecE (DUF72 family)
MEFGKVSSIDLEGITFDLPAPRLTRPPLVGKKSPVFYVGCPVWANKEWVGSWYPADAKEKDFLKYYAQQFNTIELNSTHYQIPHPSVVESWSAKVGKSFRFCPKFLQDISHTLLPRGDAKAMANFFCETMQHFGENLGMSFLQLPPFFSPKEAHFLWQFLDDLPTEYQLAVEFRQENWFVGDTFFKTAEKLQERHIATVITDTAGRRDAVHLTLSLPTLMVRFLGNNLHATDYTRIDDWVGKIQEYLDLGVQEIYFFAHEPDNVHAPELALYFIRQLAKICHIHLPEPTPTSGKQMGLF